MRGKRATKRIITPDPKYNSEVVARFVNYLMYDGKKNTSQRVMYSAFEIIKEKTSKDPLEVFETALKNIMPSVEVKSKRVGGANYQVPIQVRGDRRYALAFRWIIGVARSRKGRPMAEKLAAELMAAAEGEGDAVKKRMDVHRMAEANRAFAHFAR
ncbi:30S ribosomal protein S7 [Patescibacteria group bacterium]|nr:30S ribosomal protein S7 [Patescibacteria group bacterium]MBU1029015.1 30S ribosomal protein S7 [Patescibacteria group bacterium]MBU1915793.1 30S ribosomal protein S7 [Patescibacteria group bacterium]